LKNKLQIFEMMGHCGLFRVLVQPIIIS